MRKLLILCAVCLLLVFPVVANATSITANLSGTRSTADGTVVVTDGWNKTGVFNGFDISWLINPTTVGTTTSYSYQYTISGEGSTFLSKGLSHWILEVTNPSDATDFTMTGASAVDKDDGDLSASTVLFEGPKTFYGTGDGGSNPYMESSIYGIKWNTDGEDGIFDDNRDIVELVITFNSLKDPVWGDFYAKDGFDQSTEEIATAWNVGFGTDPGDNTTDFTNWIATPDGANGNGEGEGDPIPEPATMLLLGSGLIGFAVSGRKKLKKRNG